MVCYFVKILKRRNQLKIGGVNYSIKYDLVIVIWFVLSRLNCNTYNHDTRNRGIYRLQRFNYFFTDNICVRIDF